MQQLDVYYQHVSGIIMPIFRRPRRVLLHVVYCAVTSGEKVDISPTTATNHIQQNQVCSRFHIKSPPPYTNPPITGILPLVHLITPAPYNPPIKQAQCMHQYTRSRYTSPEKRTRHIPVQHHDTRHSHIHTRGPILVHYTLPHKKDITANIYLFPTCYSAVHHVQ